jgi:hypothetical protein
MAIEVTALIRKETKVDPRKPNDKAYCASLSLLNAEGKEYGRPRFLSEFREVAVLLRREAGVAHEHLHEQLHERHASYERGEEVRISLSLDDEMAISRLGFDPKAA